MITFFGVFWCFLPITSSLTYIDNAMVESNLKYMNMSIVYTHNERGSSVSNFTFENKVTILKMLVYLKVNIAEDQNGSQYKRELLKTVIDIEKLFKGSQGHFLIRSFINNISRFMDFKMKFPIKPVSFKAFKEFNFQ